METVNNLINAATNMVYGETNTTETTQTHDGLTGTETSTTGSSSSTTSAQEPVSGKKGSGTADDPYDAGNTTSDLSDTTTSSGPPTSKDPNSATTGTTTSDSEVAKSSATATAAQDVGSAPPESGVAPEAKQQGASKPLDAPDSEQSEAIANKNEAADKAMEEETSGDSKPLTAVGGSTGGASGPTDAGPKPLGGTGSGVSESQKEDLGSKSHEPGTGEKYIKSTGVAADGGDFDAANAGAGREADRLLEEKGVKRSDAPHVDVPAGKPPGHNSITESSEKTSLGQKLKDKLHIGSKSSS